MRSASTPARIFIDASCFQVAHGSDHVSILNDQSPGASGITHASRQSTPGAIRYMRVREYSLRSGVTRTTSAPNWSWPSLKTVARTGNASPSVAFAGRVASATTGKTSMAGIRLRRRGSFVFTHTAYRVWGNDQTKFMGDVMALRSVVPEESFTGWQESVLCDISLPCESYT